MAAIKRYFPGRLAYGVALASLMVTAPAPGCGPSFPFAVFSYSVHPDLPLEPFAQGSLGILRPEYARSYLVVAYRHLTGVGLDAAQQAAALALWKKRLGLTAPAGAEEGAIPLDEQAVAAWLAARQKVAARQEIKSIYPYKSISLENFYTNFRNCPEDAFRVAAQNLEARIQESGADSERVKRWLAAQDQVFGNCQQPGGVPSPLPDQEPASDRADRQYQIAAALFYRGDFDQAAEQFHQISQDSSSPWRAMAPYLATRCLVRQATLTPPPKDHPDARYYFHRDTLERAEAQLKALLAGPELGEYRPAAQRLARFIEFRLQPDALLANRAASLAAGQTQSLGEDLDDYTKLLDRFADDLYSDDLPKDKISPRRGELLGQGDMTDWVVHFQDNSPESLAAALQRWDQGHGLPWLVAALSKIPASHPRTPELLAAAAHVDAGSPAATSLDYQRARLLRESGQAQQAMAILDQRLAGELPLSARNQLLAERLLLARSLEEFLALVQRQPAGQGLFLDSRQIPDPDPDVGVQDPSDSTGTGAASRRQVLMDQDATTLMNLRFPLTLLQQASQAPGLDDWLRRRLVAATWVRAVLLNRDEIAMASATELAKLGGELQPGLTDYLQAKTPEARRFAAVLVLLKNPGLRPVLDPNLGRLEPFHKLDDYRDNWWCALAPVDTQDGGGWHPERALPAASPLLDVQLSFLSKEQATQAAKEYLALGKLGPAPNYLSKEALLWGKSNPKDPRVPEALHLAVKATRFGCVDQGTLSASRAAFQLLHKQFPASPWTRQTPYYYGDQ